ncbi:hypothetical protein H4R21_004625, partial [Coemansia helicoidea]
MSLGGKFAASAVSTTRFTTNVSRASARAATSAGIAPSAAGEQSSFRSSPANVGGSVSTTHYTTLPTLAKQQRFMSGFAAGPGTTKVPSFADYTKERTGDSSRAFTYFMLGASGAMLTGAAQS